MKASTFSDHPASFFTEGIVKSLQGTGNVLIVAPNMSPDTDDKNIVGHLACWLAEALGGYAVVNCGCYRRPEVGDPRFGELELSGNPKPDKREKNILKLRQCLAKETGSIPVDLDEFWFAKKAAHDFVEPIWSAVQEIGTMPSRLPSLWEELMMTGPTSMRSISRWRWEILLTTTIKMRFTEMILTQHPQLSFGN